MKLNDLKPAPGSRHKRKRVGRGPGGTDKTAGRGHKGQNSRSGGGVGPYFEGGRSSLISRLPKRGFNSTKPGYEVLNLSDLDAAPGDSFDRAALEAAGLVRRRGIKTKLLGRGEIARAVTVHVDAASESAIRAIEAAGGRVVLPEGAALSENTSPAQQEG